MNLCISAEYYIIQRQQHSPFANIFDYFFTFVIYILFNDVSSWQKFNIASTSNKPYSNEKNKGHLQQLQSALLSVCFFNTKH